MKIRPLSRFFLLDLWGSLKGRLISLILKHTCFPLCGLGEPAAQWQVAPEYGASGTGVGKPPPPYPGGGPVASAPLPASQWVFLFLGRADGAILGTEAPGGQ